MYSFRFLIVIKRVFTILLVSGLVTLLLYQGYDEYKWTYINSYMGDRGGQAGCLVRRGVLTGDKPTVKTLDYTTADISAKNWRNLSKHHVSRSYSSINDRSPMDLKCLTCAVVSNSDHLTRTGAGPEIDGHDCVFRMNLAPTTGFENDVGIKTTVRHVSNSEMTSLFYNLNVLLMQEAPEYLMIRYLPNSTSVRKIWYSRNSQQLFNRFCMKVYVLGEDQENMFIQIYRGIMDGIIPDTSTGPSSGLRTILGAVSMCDEIDVYGMPDADFCKRNPNVNMSFYYFMKTTATECKMYRDNNHISSHLFTAEKSAIGKLATAFPIHFHHPKWP